MSISNEVPDHNCCIFHNDILAFRVYRVLEKISKNWYEYGLCLKCNKKLHVEHGFKPLIAERLEEILTLVKKKQEEKNGQGRKEHV